MKILLVASPKKIFAFDTGIRLPNLGLASIAGNLKHENLVVRILDLVIAGHNPEKYLLKTIKNYQPDIIGLSCMVFQYAHTLKLARLIRQFYPTIKIVVGGYFPTVNHEAILQSNDMKYIDYIIRGEGEIAFRGLVSELLRDGDLSLVPNLSYISDGKIINNPVGPLADLDQMQLPDRGVRILKKGFYIAGQKADVIETSRGCVFECKYCSINNMYGKSFRKYTIERILNDIRDSRKFGAKSLFMVDDNITLDGKRYKEICRAIIDAGLNDMTYSIQASVKGIADTPGLIEQMAKSGVKWVFLGIENESLETLEYMNKGSLHTQSNTYEVVSELKAHGLLVIGGFILGNPGDSEESVWANFEYAKNLGVDVAYFFLLTPHPNTVIREELMEAGLITNPLDYTRYTGFNACVKTKHLSAQKLHDLRNEIGFRWYPENGEAVSRIVKHVPKWFLVKLTLEQLFKERREVMGYLKRFISRNKFN